MYLQSTTITLHYYSILKFLLVEKKTYHVVKLNLDQNGQRNDRKGNIFGGNGGSVVKNPPAEAGDMGSIPVPGRSNKLRSNEAHVPQTIKPML